MYLLSRGAFENVYSVSVIQSYLESLYVWLCGIFMALNPAMSSLYKLPETFSRSRASNASRGSKYIVLMEVGGLQFKDLWSVINLFVHLLPVISLQAHAEVIRDRHR